MTKEQLIKRIKETSYLEGDFTLRSGKKSKYYLDKYLFETCPDILKALGEAENTKGKPTVIIANTTKGKGSVIFDVSAKVTWQVGRFQ